MNKSDAILAGMAFGVGVLLGGGYFAGLWLTVCRMPKAPSPYRLYALSFLLRLILVLGGFYLLVLRGPLALVAGGLGFLVARQLWLLGKKGAAKQAKEFGDGEQ